MSTYGGSALLVMGVGLCSDTTTAAVENANAEMAQYGGARRENWSWPEEMDAPTINGLVNAPTPKEPCISCATAAHERVCQGRPSAQPNVTRQAH